MSGSVRSGGGTISCRKPDPLGKSLGELRDVVEAFNLATLREEDRGLNPGLVEGPRVWAFGRRCA